MPDGAQDLGNRHGRPRIGCPQVPGCGHHSEPLPVKRELHAHRAIGHGNQDHGPRRGRLRQGLAEQRREVLLVEGLIELATLVTVDDRLNRLGAAHEGHDHASPPQGLDLLDERFDCRHDPSFEVL